LRIPVGSEGGERVGEEEGRGGGERGREGGGVVICMS
jgi:hypothetical protein